MFRTSIFVLSSFPDLLRRTPHHPNYNFFVTTQDYGTPTGPKRQGFRIIHGQATISELSL